MSDKPQQPDILDQIMGQDAVYRSDVSRETSEAEDKGSVSRETPGTAEDEANVSRETPNTAGGPIKNKRSSVYIYLVVLFGAAFLMLLLAYFVQQRNNATVQDDLRTITASREELLEEIKALEGENQALQAERDALQTELDQANIHLEVYTEIAGRVVVTENENLCWLEFWGMEEDFRNGEYEACAESFRLWYGSNYYMTPEPARARAEEIYHELVRLSYLSEDDLARW